MLRAGRSGVRVPVWARDFLFFKTPSLAVGPNQPTIQLVPIFFPGDDRSVKLISHLYPAPRLRMGGVIPLLPYMPSQRGQGKLRVHI